MIVGIGVDIVKIDRIENLYRKYGNKLCEKILSKEELLRIDGIKEDKKPYFLAKRFAAKEAVAKALGIGIGRAGFKNISILNDSSGRPFVIMDSESDYKNLKIDISISDDYPFAIAFSTVSR